MKRLSRAVPRAVRSLAGVLLFGAAVVGGAGCEQKGGPLKVERVEPAEGTTGGGDQVTIVGSGFEPGKTQAEVRFGRRKSENVVIASPNKIIAVTPSNEKGPVEVSVMFDNGKAFTIPSGFKFVPPAAGTDVRKAFFSGKKE